MRLQALKISGFRGFADEQSFDLSADVILVHGPNGSGKTSLFDAILWALTGNVDRLGPASALVSRYAGFGQARVELALRSSDGLELIIVRRFDGESVVTVEVGGRQLAGPAAEAQLRDLVWPESNAAPNPEASLTRSVTRAIYLQQDQVRSFLEAEDEQSRFAIVAEIVGAGRVGELVRQLESGRRAWSGATNRLREELEPLVRRRDALRKQTGDLEAGAREMGDVEREWIAWRDRATSLLGSDMPSIQGERNRVLERCVEALRQSQRREEQRLAKLGEIADLIDRLPLDLGDDQVERERSRVAADEAEVASLSVALEEAQTQTAQARERRVNESQLSESLAALAQLALRHLGDRCPVCTQTYDPVVTREHLRDLVRQSSEVAPVDEGEVQDAAARLRAAEQKLAATRSRLMEVERRSRELDRLRRQVADLARELHLPPEPQTAETARRELNEAVARRDLLQAARRDAEGLAVSLARSSELDQLSDYLAQMTNLEADIELRERDIARRDAASDDARLLHESLRQLSESLVTTELKRIEPVLQRIYASVDPHPSFRVVQFLADTRRGRGRLWTSVTDPLGSVTEPDPGIVLSSSQMNVLAVVAFLALNLTVSNLPLQVIALDDPLQSLDNINLLGLCDLLRRLRTDRQVILSTHDQRLAGLLERKLRPVLAGERTIVVTMDGWSRNGPVVTQYDVPTDASELRLIQVA